MQKNLIAATPGVEPGFALMVINETSSRSSAPQETAWRCKNTPYPHGLEVAVISNNNN